MKYTIRQIRESLPVEKNKTDGLWTRFVLRPLSLPVAWGALRLNLSANAISYLSALFGIGGAVLFSFDGFLLPLWGAILFNFFSILDCVDGNMARVTGTDSPWGGWADAMTGFITYTAVFLSTGVYAYLRTGWWPFLVVAALTSSANLLTRVAYQNYKNIEPGKAHGEVSFERKLAENLGITGFLMPALVLCHLVGGMPILIWFNLAFYLGGCGLTLGKLARKAAA